MSAGSVSDPVLATRYEVLRARALHLLRVLEEWGLAGAVAPPAVASAVAALAGAAREEVDPPHRAAAVPGEGDT